jgi:hypothetical protein
MLSWFRASPPLQTSEKAWTEHAMRRLADWFGVELLRRAEFIIPDEYRPAYDGSETQACSVFDEVCRTMQVPRGELDFEIVDDEQLPGAVGHYARYAAAEEGADAAAANPIVRLKRSQLVDLCQLTATIAHEVAHHRLFGGGFHLGDEPDLETTTDLLPIFFGYGLFPANATVRFTATHTLNWEHWSISRQGYLPSRVFGYALALAAAFRGEHRPRWSKALRPDAKEPFDRGERYLATGDSLFLPNTYQRSAASPSTAELVHRLAGGTATFRYDALRELEERRSAGTVPLSQSDADRVTRLLYDRDADVAAAAARTLSACRPASDSIVHELQRAVWSSRIPVRAAAIRALGRLEVCNHETMDSLGRLLAEDHTDIIEAVAAAVAHLGERASELAVPLLRLLQQANIAGKDALSLTAARAVASVVADPVEAVLAHYRGGDPELRMLALDAVRAVLGEANGDESTPA